MDVKAQQSCKLLLCMSTWQVIAYSLLLVMAVPNNLPQHWLCYQCHHTQTQGQVSTVLSHLDLEVHFLRHRRAVNITSESELVLRYLLKKLLLLLRSTFSSSVLVMLPLCTRYMPRGLFTKKG